MTDTTPEGIQIEASNALTDIELTSRTPFPVKYFAKKSPATRRLIERTDGTVEMRADNRWYSAHFEEPQLVSVIRVFHKELSKNPKFNFGFLRHSDGKAIRVARENISHLKTKEDRDYIEVKIFQFIEGISFEPPRGWKKGRAVTGIEIYGYDRENFEKAVGETLNVFSLKSDTEQKFSELVKEANAKIAKADALNEEIIVLDQKKTDLTSSLSLLREELQSLNQKHSQVESDITVRTEVFNKIESDINARDNQTSVMDRNIEDLETKKTQINNELKKLQNQLDLFPAELSEFNQQGRDKSISYMWLALLPVLVIVGITASLLFGAADLTTKYKSVPNIDLTTLVASRLPFAFIAIFILHISFQLTKILIREVFRISRQQLALSKLSIVAQEVTKSSREGLDLTDNEVFDLKTKLKMTLLRSHLKTYLDDEFDFEVDSSVFGSMLKRIKKPKPEVSKEASDVVKHAIDKAADLAEGAIKGES